MGAFDKTVRLDSIRFFEKKIVFIPMIHIATPEFYRDVKTKIDSLKENGFFFVFEGVKDDIAETDTLSMYKLRQILGQPYKKTGNKQKDSTHLYNWLLSYIKRKYELKDSLTIQPYPPELGLDSTNAVNVDKSISWLIKRVEQETGKIKIGKCERKIPLDTTALCILWKARKHIKNKKVRSILITERNKHVVQYVINAPYRKIAIIYGKEHINGIKKLFLEQKEKQKNKRH
ncbi:hypothetical protein [Caminibacter sp.]